MSCATCMRTFQLKSVSKAKSRGFRKHSVTSHISPGITVADAIIKVHDLRFATNSEQCVCAGCFYRIRKCNTLRCSLASAESDLCKFANVIPAPTTRKRKLSTSTVPTTKRRTTFLDNAVQLIRERNYAAGFKLLANKSQLAKRMLVAAVASVVKKEVNTITPTALGRKLTPDAVSQFDWAHVIPEIEDTFPVLFSIIKAAIQTRRKHVEVKGKHIGYLVPGLGVIMAVILHLHRPTRYKFLQQLISIVMFRSGCSQKFMTWMNKLGFCMGDKATRQLIDGLAMNFDSKLTEWKRNIQVDHGVFDSDDVSAEHPFDDSSCTTGVLSSITSQAADSGADSESTVLYSDCTDVVETDNDVSYDDATSLHVTTTTADTDLLEPGYSLCWDNVQKLSTVRHQCSHHHNEMLMWANCYGVRNRISFRHLDMDEKTSSPSSIPLHKFLPTEHDLQDILSRMAVIVERVLVKYVETFKGTPVLEHVPHKYSDKSEDKSDIVNLGVIKEDPSSTKGVIQIMKQLNNYVPSCEGRVLYQIVCHGDQLSVERMVNARLSIASSAKPINQMEGLYPRPQNFHKRVIILQDTMDKLYTSSSSQVGTLMNIKSRFGHRNVKKKVSECTNNVVDFIKFVTEGHVILLFKHLVNDESVPNDDADRHIFLSSIATKIVRFVLPNINMADTLGKIIGENTNTKYCICSPTDDVTSDIMVECSSRELCPRGRWFHDVCVGANEITGDWWCSDNCKSAGTSAYCCMRQRDELMIRCDARDECTTGEYFHPSCIGQSTSVGNGWYCSDRCRCTKHKEQIDHVQEYTKAVLWRGLLHMVETDCERENDGMMMMTMWRWNVFDFWANNHYKYLCLTHRLLTAINGWATTRLSQELIWNSTANLHGNAGNNLALDLVNEFMNNDFKANLKASRGQYTDKNVQRRSRVVGSIGKYIDDSFSKNVVHKYTAVGKANVSYKSDVHKFITVYAKEMLFACQPGRKHNSFAKFSNDIEVRNPEKLRTRLMNYSAELQMEHDLFQQ